MIFIITCILAVISAIVGVLGFVLYIRARMMADEKKEKFYLKLHYTALTLLLLFVIAALNLYEDSN
ncbi:MAG: hypothetical protein EKK37_13950 [Sphingobacteriales bacterium]|nr:MAG: hypothetical protein EKK37_13950 [Sphingobacteriales bacterium]